MTQFLLRRLVRDSENRESPTVRYAVGRLSGWVGIGCNLILFAMKLMAGIVSGSVSITADAMNNLSDASGAIVTLLGFHLAKRPADQDHPFGHARFEYLSGLAVAVMIILIGFELGKSSVQKILHPADIEFTITAGLILVGSLAIKLWLSRFYTTLGRHIRSTALLASAADSRNDCIATGAVLLAMLIQSLTHWRIDGFIGAGVAVFILCNGWQLIQETISPLLGEAASPELQKQILEFVQQQPHVLGCHDLMVHDYGPGHRFASIHVEMDRNRDPLACHELIDQMERSCFARYGIHLVIHYDPIVVDDPELNRLRSLVTGILRVKDPRLEVHDFRMVPGQGQTNLIFDISLPLSLSGQEAVLQQSLETALNALGEGQFHTVITFDPA